MVFIVLFTYLFILHSTLGTSTTYYLLAFKFFFPVLKIKPRALYKLDKHFTTKLYPQSSLWLL